MDPSGNRLTTQSDAEGRTTSYEYDDFGRRTTRTLPGSAVETTAYDKFGRVTTKTNFKGQVEELVYDDDVRVPIAQRLNLGRVIQKRYYASAGAAEDTTQRVSYTYDALGRTATLTDPRGTTTYTYDGEGRETQVASPEGTINYVYGTTAGNGKDRLVRAYTAHDDQSYTYDALGRLASVTANVIRGITLNEAGSYVYDLNGNLRSWSLTGRATALHVYSYDELNRLTTLTRQNFTEPMTWSYATDKTGRKTTDGAKFRWEYDALGRLTREQYDANNNWTVDSANDYITTFAYDLVGNRKKKVTDKLGTTSDETVTYVYNSRDELTSETSTLSGTTTYVYDANGSLTSKTKGTAVESYGYDKRNKMTSYTSSSGTVTTYKYDDEGLRVQRKVGTAAATLYLLNHHNQTGYPVAFEERSGTSTSMPTVAYVVGHDVVRQSQDAAGTGTTDGHLHLVYDGQGNMRGNVGTINVGPTTIFATVGGTRDYTAFGELISGSLVSNLRHHGEYFDGITGFYFQGVRQRVTFAWAQEDDYTGSFRLPLTLHKYGFVHQDPINGFDPSGYFTITELLGNTGIMAKKFAARAGPLYNIYDKYDTVSEAARIISSVIRGAPFDMVSAVLLGAEFFPFGKLLKRLPPIPGTRGFLGQAQDSLRAFYHKAKGLDSSKTGLSQLIGETGAAFAAKVKGLSPSKFSARYHGPDALLRDASGTFIIVEAKGGAANLVVDAAGRGQMSRRWIEDRVEKLIQKARVDGIDIGEIDELERQLRGGQIKGMVVNTKLDGPDAFVPQFEMKNMDEIGPDRW